MSWIKNAKKIQIVELAKFCYIQYLIEIDLTEHTLVKTWIESFLGLPGKSTSTPHKREIWHTLKDTAALSKNGLISVLKFSSKKEAEDYLREQRELLKPPKIHEVDLEKLKSK